MSFSSDVKVELSKISNLKNKDEVLLEFLGYMSTVNTNNEDKVKKFSTENEYNINRFSKLLNNINITNYTIELQGKIYIIKFKDVDNIKLKELETFFVKENLIKSYIRGAFLGGGSINNPKNKYHLEIIFSNEDYAKITINLLLQFNIKAKLLSKQNKYSLYIKDSEEISKFLALIGANSSVLKFEEERVIHDMKNNVNRIVNCETANLNKTINTAVEQISDIKRLKREKKFESLPEELKELAKLRIENPNATLEELSKMLKRPISKSNVNYRFKKIKEYL